MLVEVSEAVMPPAPVVVTLGVLGRAGVRRSPEPAALPSPIRFCATAIPSATPPLNPPETAMDAAAAETLAVMFLDVSVACTVTAPTVVPVPPSVELLMVALVPALIVFSAKAPPPLSETEANAEPLIAIAAAATVGVDGCVLVGGDAHGAAARRQ